MPQKVSLARKHITIFYACESGNNLSLTAGRQFFIFYTEIPENNLIQLAEDGKEL
jgi:hypothetical protein